MANESRVRKKRQAARTYPTGSTLVELTKEQATPEVEAKLVEKFGPALMWDCTRGPGPDGTATESARCILLDRPDSAWTRYLVEKVLKQPKKESCTGAKEE
ncbi:MAG: hypothetical protein HY556_02375 [Euryarchaeota archaeon]|nr:hypothetical protein [Euryarchaeota archaeon]